MTVLVSLIENRHTMNIKQIEECLISINEDRYDKHDSMKKLYKENILYISYFMFKILKEEYDISEYINRVFDKTFKYCEEQNATVNEYILKLKESTILVCDSVLKSKVGEYNDKLEINDNGYSSTDITEDGTDDSSLFSNEIRDAVIGSIDNLTTIEKIIAYSYYYLEFDFVTISNILDISYDLTINIHQKIKYCIVETLKNIFHTNENIPYTKNIMRIYFYNDQNNLSKKLLDIYDTDDYYFEQYGFLKKRPKPESGEEILPETNDEDNKKKKRKALLITILVSVLALFIITGISGIFIYKRYNSDTETSTATQIETTREELNETIDLTDNEITLCKGDEYTLNIKSSSNQLLSSLMGIKEYSEKENQIIYYQITDNNVISYNPIDMKITAVSSGDTVFTIGTNKNGAQSKSSIIVHVYDIIEEFSFEDEIIGVIYGEEQELVLKTNPEIDYKNIKWTSDNENMVLAYNGKVIGLSIGETKVYAEVKGFVDDKLTTLKAEVIVKVVKKLDTSVKVRGSFENKINDMYVGQSYRLNYTCTPNEDYVYLKIVTYDDSDILYDPQTKILTPLKPGPVLIYLYNGLNTTEHLDSFMVTIHGEVDENDG